MLATSWRTDLKSGWILLGLTLLPSLGCLNECQQLCNSWYGFRSSVCGDAVEATDLNRCLSDHRTVVADPSEGEACGAYLAYVEQLDDGDTELCTTLATGDGAFQLQVIADEAEEEP